MFSVVFLIALVLSASVATEHGVATLSSGVHQDALYRGASTSAIAGTAENVRAGNDTATFENFGEVRYCHCFFAYYILVMSRRMQFSPYYIKILYVMQCSRSSRVCRYMTVIMLFFIICCSYVTHLHAHTTGSGTCQPRGHTRG